MSGFPEEWPKEVGTGIYRELDSAVRCPICGELFEAPLSLRCGHSFCSGCIRSSIAFQERSGPACCPSCRDRCDTADLRPAPQLRAIATAFAAARPSLLSAVEAALAPVAPQSGAGENGPAAQQGSAHRQSQQRRRQRQANKVAAPDSLQQANGGDAIALELSSDSEADCSRQPAAKRTRLATHSASRATAGEGGGARTRQQRSSPVANLATQTPVVNDRRVLRSGSHTPASAGPIGTRGSGGAAHSNGQRAGSLPPAASPSSEYEAQSVCSSSDGDSDFVVTSPPRRSASPAVPAQPPAAEKLPKGHVRCPNCGAMLPGSFINAHLDSCLLSGGSGGGRADAKTLTRGEKTLARDSRTASTPRDQPSSRQAPAARASAPAAVRGSGPHQPLKVPPKLCVALLSDKAMRDVCKKYGLPVVGKKDVLAERYARFRLEVQTANDTGERATYDSIARRVTKRETRTAAATSTFGQPRAAKSAPALGGGEDSFEDLIRATRERQAAQRKAAAAAQQPASSPVSAAERISADAAPAAVPAAAEQLLADAAPAENQQGAGSGTAGTASGTAAASRLVRAATAGAEDSNAVAMRLDGCAVAGGVAMTSGAREPDAAAAAPSAMDASAAQPATAPDANGPASDSLRLGSGQGDHLGMHHADGGAPEPSGNANWDYDHGISDDRGISSQGPSPDIMCTQLPPQRSCGQELAMFDSAFSDDSLPCQLSPSV